MKEGIGYPPEFTLALDQSNLNAILRGKREPLGGALRPGAHPANTS